MLGGKFASVILGIFTLLFFSASLVSPALSYSESEAQAKNETATAAAEATILKCYNATFEAERAGANVSGLLAILNEAGWFLSLAKVEYAYGNFDSAFSYAKKCIAMLEMHEGFVAQANDLKAEAEQAAYYDFMVNFLGSGLGGLCIVVGGFVAWKFFGKRENVKEKA